MKQLYVLLVHGTWSAGRWTQVGSPFRDRLETGLKKIGFKPIVESIPWNGRNRWRARSFVAGELDHRLDNLQASLRGEWEYLVIAHSHGGNIATEAVRTRLATVPDTPIRGVVCLNTPFLSHEARGSGGYMLVWFLAALVLAISIGLIEHLVRSVGPMSQGPIIPILGYHPRTLLVVGLPLISLAILLLLGLSRRVQRAQREFAWGPRPETLCLSCPDDEAITFLGLGEGIANLPQLLFHPLSLLAIALLGGFLLYRVEGIELCLRLGCWDMAVSSFSLIFLLWTLLAIFGGLVGAIAVSMMFGLSWSQTIATLVSRVLVSYVPLRPARAFFRGIHELPLGWGNPIRIFHSQIYDSPQTIREICEWLEKHTAAPTSVVRDKGTSDSNLSFRQTPEGAV